MLKRAHSNHHSLTLHGGADGCCQVVVCPGAETSLSETDTELESIPGIELALPSSPLRNLLKQCDQEKEKKKKKVFLCCFSVQYLIFEVHLHWQQSYPHRDLCFNIARPFSFKITVDIVHLFKYLFQTQKKEILSWVILRIILSFPMSLDSCRY